MLYNGRMYIHITYISIQYCIIAMPREIIKFRYFIACFMFYFIDEDCTVVSRLTRPYINIYSVLTTIKHVQISVRVLMFVFFSCVRINLVGEFHHFTAYHRYCL